MKVGIAGPINLSLLTDLFPAAARIPSTYSFALTANLAREFHARGHEVVLFALSREVASIQQIAGPRIRGYICPARLPRWQMMDFFREERRALCEAMRASKCDVIHAHWTYEFGSAAVRSNLPHVVTAHDVPMAVLRFARHPFWMEKPWLALSVLRNAKCVTAVSPYLADQLERFLRPQKDVVVIPNGVPADFFSLVNRRPNQNAKSQTFASILNGWGPLKNSKTLIKAFGIARDKLGDKVELMMIGDGFQKGGPAERWAQRRNLGSGIRFEGPLSHTEVVKKLVHEVDVLVHPSLEETFCMVALEAMAVGVPVIGGRDAGALPWLLDGGKFGTLVDVRSAPALAESMMCVVDDRLRAKQRVLVARSAAREKFSIRGVADKYERLCQLQIQ